MSARSRIVEMLTPRLRVRRRLAALALSSAIALLSAVETHAAMKIDGDAEAMTVTVAEVPRRRVVAVLSQRFGFKISGQIIDNGPVNGRFRGDLGDVLGRILPSNNFLVVYEGGKPARILLSERGNAQSLPPDPAMRSLRPNAGMMDPAGEGGHGGGNYRDGEGRYIDPGQIISDPSMQDPSMQDPAMYDPAMLNPAMQDPAMQDPAMLGRQRGDGPPLPEL